jgi:lysyl endopeptidase
LDQRPPAAWNLFYGGWDNTTTASTAQLGVHHPSADIMKLCRNDQAAISQTAFRLAAWIISD